MGEEGIGVGGGNGGGGIGIWEAASIFVILWFPYLEGNKKGRCHWRK